MVAAYSETAYTLDQQGLLTNLEKYLTAEDLDKYVDSYIEEGRLGEAAEFKIFPTAKATEVLMLNKTDWDKFSEATGASIKGLTTWEGIRATAKMYYEWTDSLTEAENDGKAFFGRDALANYILVGSKQQGEDIFYVEDDVVRVRLNPTYLKRIWDNYYIPYISGYFTSNGKFSSDDVKIGEIIALVGSTTGVPYFPEEVSIGDDEQYPIEMEVLPLPNFADAGRHAVQQGAGMVVLESDAAHEEAAVEFLKWFTEENRNSIFSAQTGYLPVKKTAYEEKDFMTDHEGAIPEKLQETIPLAMKQMRIYDLYYSGAFTQGLAARQVLATSLEQQSMMDREKVIQQLNKGITLEEAISEFSTEEHYDEWFKQVKEQLLKVVDDEK